MPKDVTVFETGSLIDVGIAADALKRERIPYFQRAAGLSGREVAMLRTPSPGIGVLWSIRVAPEDEKIALNIIKSLRLDHAPAQSWPAGDPRRARFKWVPFVIIPLMVLVGIAVVNYLFFR